MNELHILLLLAAASWAALYVAGRFSAGWRGAHARYLRIAALCAVSALILTPFVWLVCAAFKAPGALMTHTFLPPLGEISAQTINLGNFQRLFAARSTSHGEVYFWQYIMNSILLASAQTTIQLIFCSMGGYALAKYRFRGKRLFMGFMLGTMMFPGMILLAPLYKMIVQLGLIDTYWALLVPFAANAFGVFLFRQAILGIPDDLIEAGRMDGCGEYAIYWRIVMPLIRPMCGAFCLIAYLAAWNNFLGPQIFLNSNYKLPLTVILAQYLGLYYNDYGVFLAGTLLAIIPPAALFFALQREFISGLTSGAVKG